MRIVQIASLLVALAFVSPLHALTEEEPSRFGVLIPLTGPFAPVGEDCRRGVAVAEKLYAPGWTVSGRRISPLFEDTQAEGRIGVAAFRSVAQRGALAVIAMRGPAVMPMNPVSREKAIPLIGVVSNNQFTVENEFAFQSWSNSVEEGLAIAHAMQKQGAKRIAILTAEDDYLVAISAETEKALRSLGATVVADESIHPSTPVDNGQITRLLARRPDVVFMNVTLQQLPDALRRLKESRSSATIFSNYFVSKREVIEGSRGAAEGVYFVEASLKLPKFKAVLSEIFSSDSMSSVTLTCGAAASLLMSAVRASALPLSRETVHGALKARRWVRLPDASLQIRERKIAFPLATKRVGRDGAILEE